MLHRALEIAEVDLVDYPPQDVGYPRLAWRPGRAKTSPRSTVDESDRAASCFNENELRVLIFSRTLRREGYPAH